MEIDTRAGLEGARVLEEIDLALVDALQVHPRASWTKLGRVLELAPVTLSRRWERLTDTGAAWVSVAQSPAATRGAIIELSCAPRTEMRVAEQLAELPYVSTVGITTGDFQVYANVLAPTIAALSHTLLHSMPLPEQVIRVRSHVFSGMFGGVLWRLGVMNRTQSEQVRETVGPPPHEIRPFGAADRSLFLALGHDGRRSYTDLADELGSTPHSIRRRLNRLNRHGDITFRCDVARALAGWHTMAMLWLRVPDGDVRSIGRSLGTWPETRQCAAVASPTNLGLIVNLHSFEHLEQVATRIAHEHPTARIIDRCLVLRQVKVYGRLVDEEGRCTRVIPVDPWATSPP